MAASRPENHDNGAEHGGIVSAAREFVATLPKSHATDAAAREGIEIAAIVEALGLPDDVVAAVHLYARRCRCCCAPVSADPGRVHR
jgi:hypothetical protein